MPARGFLTKLGGGLAAVGWLVLSAIACAQPLKHVTVAVGTTRLNVGYPMDTLPLILGYWKAAGYEVDVQPVGNSLQAIQQMVAGNADFGQINASTIVQSNVTNHLPVRLLMANGVNDWSIAVPPNSDIRSVSDLKGKTIGMFIVSAVGSALLESSLREVGMSTEASGVSLLPVGLGAPPVQSLRRGQVDALLYWGSAIASFENAGLELREVTPPKWRTYPDFSFATMEKTAARDPDMVVAIAKGVAMATVYALANPECAVKLHWQRYPETKPSGVDDAAALRMDLNTLNAQLRSLTDGFKLNGGRLWGNADPAGLDRLQAFLNDAGIVKGTLPPTAYLASIPNFYEKINDFDVGTIQAAAKKCEVAR
jgi:NitT/TauT family transport system substrate-binding protein